MKHREFELEAAQAGVAIGAELTGLVAAIATTWKADAWPAEEEAEEKCQAIGFSSSMMLDAHLDSGMTLGTGHARTAGLTFNDDRVLVYDIHRFNGMLWINWRRRRS